MEAAARLAIFAEIARCPGPRMARPSAGGLERENLPAELAGVFSLRFQSVRTDRGRDMSQKPNVTRPKSLKARMAGPEVDLGFRWGVLNSALLGLGVAVLVVGYMSLAKGSLTLAPLLLVTGYCVMIPASLLVRGTGSNGGE
jgi:hypothetical protein